MNNRPQATAFHSAPDSVRIFISYVREDEERVEQLYQRLADGGFKPWLDREHILPGMQWEPVIIPARVRGLRYCAFAG